MNYLVSIVICTADRCASLKRTLLSIEAITYSNIEIIIVDASLNSDTFDLIETTSKDFKYPIKFSTIKQRNLSLSRNIGIKLSSGEILAFIDDDAVPALDWIDKLLQIYSLHGDKCAGVGGVVREMNTPGFPLQFERGITNVISETIAIRSTNAPSFNDPKGFWFNGFMGTNSSYRKKYLEEIKGYDEFFEYFLDETDVCLRLIKTGYELYYSDTLVDHYCEPSHNRREKKYLTCWYSLAKNTTYFAIKHGLKKIPFPILITRLTALLIKRCFLRILRLKLTHNLPFSLILKYLQESIQGITTGWEAGMKIHKSASPQQTVEIELTRAADIILQQEGYITQEEIRTTKVTAQVKTDS